MIRSGVLGEVRELHVWTDRAATWWPQGIDRPTDTPAGAQNLDWDLWLGGRPSGLIIRPTCRSSGGAGRISAPGRSATWESTTPRCLWPPCDWARRESVEIVETSGLKSETFPKWARLRCQFPASGGHKPVVLYWYDGGQKPPENLIGRKLADNGAIVVGSEGTLCSAEWTGGEWRLFPEEKFRDYKPPQPTLPRAPGRTITWNGSRPARADGPAFCNFVDFAAPLTEVMLVGALALRDRQGPPLERREDAGGDCPEAAPFIRREYRKSWEIGV